MNELPMLPVCRHRGREFAPGRWSCCSPRLLLPLGTNANLCAAQCPYVDHGPTEPAAGSESNEVLSRGIDGAADENHGVAIGTFDSQSGQQRYGVEAVRLNLAVLRARCGDDVRILVCDDCSPPESQGAYRAVCAEYGAEFTTNDRRWGHTSGDMIVYYKAISWARRHGLATVTKLSHRMVIDAPQWIQEDARNLLDSGHATQAQMLGNYPTDQVRSECVMMVVREWARTEVLDWFAPRRIATWNEGHVFAVIRAVVDQDRPYPGFLPWQRISFLRGADRPPVYFRSMAGDPREQFHRLAARYGITLSPGFSVLDSNQSRDYVI